MSTLKGFHSAMQYQLKYHRLHCPAADGHDVSLLDTSTEDLLVVPSELRLLDASSVNSVLGTDESHLTPAIAEPAIPEWYRWRTC